MRFWAYTAIASLCLAAPFASAESIYNFDNVAANTNLPLALSVNGLTATFGGGAAVCAAAGFSGNMFIGLTGNALMQGFCDAAANGPVTVSFSQSLSKLTFAVAVNGADPVPVVVTYLNRGVAVKTLTITPVVPANSVSPEATVAYSGTFDTILISSSRLLAIDNVDAIPAS